jgi:two-component system, NtrC family, response regulator AlgB
MHILIIDDEANIRKTTAIALEAMGHEAVEASDGASAKKHLEKESFDVALLDLRLGDEQGLDLLPELLKLEPDLAVIVFTAFATLETAVQAVKSGAYDYIPKPFTPEQIRQVLQKVQKTRRLEGQVVGLESQLSADSPMIDFQTKEPQMQELCDMISKAAATSATILILGESGTGKSMLARAVHQQSDRKGGALVTVNCPSLSRELLESELFGHAKGSFTGAVADTAGKTAAAEGGTLFLDEIGELPMEIQPKLLRLLQEREYERVGDPKPRRANVRVIAATNRNLEKAIKEGKFREDLYYRLNVFSVEMPPLRARMGDLLPIAEKQLQFFSAQIGKKMKGFSADAVEALQRHSWPGNLRELRNTIERAVILASGDQIELLDLPKHRIHNETVDPVDLGSMVTLDALEKEHIRCVVSKSDNLEKAAQILGIDSATLYRKRKKFHLE